MSADRSKNTSGLVPPRFPLVFETYRRIGSWEESDNHHHADSFRRAAAAIGYELQGDRGDKRPRP